MKLIRAFSLPVMAVAFFTSSAAAQQAAAAPGRIVGRVVDAATGTGLSAVSVEVVGSNVGSISGLDGRFVINNVPAGPTTLRATSIGYGVKSVTDIRVTAGGAVEQNISLEAEAVAISAIEVTAAAERGSVNRALDQQRAATGIVNAITSEQIAGSPDGDAAQAVQRVSGVTVQDGKYVVVRGLGERYTTTSLNGARIPSPEPERKMVPLDLFPTALVEQITTSKTFTPEQSADFSGAQVNIKTREFTAEPHQAISLGVGLNAAAAGLAGAGPARLGAEWLAFGAGDRSLPGPLRAAGKFEQQLSQEEVNTMVRSMNNSWSGQGAANRPNTSFGASIGGNQPLFGQRIGYLVSGTYSLGQEAREQEVRALAFPTDDGSTSEIDRFTGNTLRSSVLWGVIANFSTLLGSSSRIAANTSYNRSADNEARFEVGYSDDDAFPLQISRLRYVERSVASGQLIGEHEMAPAHRLDWAITSSRVSRTEPDRSEFVYEMQPDPLTGAPQAPAWLSAANEGAVRTYSELTESAVEAKADYGIKLGSAQSHLLKVGALARRTDREADNRAYSITAPGLTRAERMRPAEDIIAEYAQPGSNVLRILPLLQGGSYAAADQLFAGYGQIELALSDRIRVITGARIEHSQVDVLAEPTIGDAVNVQPRYTDLLPALTVNLTLSERQNLRLSASRTLARPEYREMSPIAYRDVIGGDNVVGNAELQRSLIRNFDLRWELYPGSGEILSLGLFGKRFQDPVERVYLGTSGTRMVTFVNAESATNYGAELELRKNLSMLAHWLAPVTFSTNVTLMHSDITLRGGGQFEDRRPMVGQAPYVVNAALAYAARSGRFSGTLLYNVAGKRIHSASEAPLPDVYEQPRQMLDIALRFPFFGNVAAKLDLKNVLDSPFEVRQGTAVREFYKSGRVISVGLTYKP